MMRTALTAITTWLSSAATIGLLALAGAASFALGANHEAMSWWCTSIAIVVVVAAVALAVFAPPRAPR